MRCYGLISPRSDNKVSIHLNDIGDYQHEWNVDDLPWDAVTPLLPGEEPPETLDQKLMDAVIAKALPPAEEMPPKAHGAALAFLYLYMSLAHADVR